MRVLWTAILLSCFVAQLMANPPDGISEYLIFTEDTKISRMNLDGQKHETILESLTSPTGMAVDLVSGVIFYTDADDRSISRSNLDGSDARTIMSIEGSPFGVAVDPEQLTVYWCDKENGRIEKCNYVGGDRTVVVDGLEQPMGIALDLINRKVYWADINAAFIGRANMDGSDQERQLAVSEGTTAAPSGWPETLVLDEDGTLFWSDVFTRKIYRRTVDGVCTVVVSGPSQVKGMAIHDGYIYYSELFEMKISRVPTTGGIPEVIKDNLLFPRGIVIARATDALPAPTTAVPIGTQDPPVLEMIRDAQGAVTFQCTVPAVTNVEQFLVTWKSNFGATIVRTELVNAGVLNLVLAESNYNVIQDTLACIVQTRVVRRDEELGPEVSSNVFTATQEVSPSRLEMTEGDESQDITVRFNAPPVFYEGNEGFFLRPELQEADDEITDVDGQVIEQLVFEAQQGTLSSEILVTNTNWDQVHTFKVKAKLDGMVDRTKTRLVQIYRQSATGRLRRKRDNGSRTLVGETETIVVNGDSNAECEVEGEPRITTFDGRVYDNHMEGEFILFKHKLRAAQVNVVFQSCGAGSCVCAVLIKALNNVYAFDKCRRQGQRGDGHLRRYRIGRQKRYSRVRIISENFGWRHKVLLPGSREVTIGGEWWSVFTPVLFKPSSDRLDFMQTQGLCGYYDKDVVNDLMFFDGTVQSEPLPQPSDNVQFNHEYSCLKRADFSLLNGVLDDSHEEIPVVYCRSGEQREECEEDLDSLVNDAKYDITDDIPVVAPDGGNQGRRRKRSVVSSLDFDPFAPIVYDPNHNVGQVVWPTASGRTLQEVQDHCRNKLMSHTGVQLCATVLNVTFEKDINGCVQDIGMTDELAWADRSVSAVIERCISFVNRQDNSAPKGAPKPLLPGGVNRTELMSKVCPSGCSQQGACAEGKCTCFEGFTGSDCSMRLTDPPELTTLGETFCDVTTQKCDVIVVFGWKFHHRESLTCHLQEYELGQPLPASRPQTVKARFRKFDEIVCSVPTGHSNMGYIVRVSNDGVTMTTESRLFRKYDSRCHDCYMEGEDITKATCEIQPFTCVIGGHCYDARQSNPLNRCLVCQPDDSTEEWTVNRDDDTTCQTTTNQETEDLILIIGSVVGVIIGITVLVGVVAICISQRKFFKNEMANAESQPNAPRRLSQTITPMARDNPIYTLETDVNGIREQVPTNGGVVAGDPFRRPSLAWMP